MSRVSETCSARTERQVAQHASGGQGCRGTLLPQGVVTVRRVQWFRCRAYRDRSGLILLCLLDPLGKASAIQ